MTARIKIKSYTNLGAVKDIDVIGHESVRHFTISMDCGYSEQQWPSMQTIPKTEFTLYLHRPRVTAAICPFLRRSGVKVIRYNLHRTRSYFEVMPEDAAQTIRVLNFGEDIVAQVIRMQEDAASRRKTYIQNLKPSDIEELKRLVVAKADRIYEYVRHMGPFEVEASKPIAPGLLKSDGGIPQRIMRVSGPRPAFTL
jgi:hypothetical protein